MPAPDDLADGRSQVPGRLALEHVTSQRLAADLKAFQDVLRLLMHRFREGATIVTVADPWVDPISTAPDDDAVSIIDVNATLIPSPIVSQCH